MGVFSSGGVGIDLGSANVTIFLESEGVVLREPSYVLASRDDPDTVLACGRDARQMLGRPPRAAMLVSLDGRPLGKPADENEAHAMLRALSGRAHEVFTGVCLRDAATGREMVEDVMTAVRFRELTDKEIWDYIHTGEPMDKAGAYGIQGGAGAFVEGLDGSFENVMGFPVDAVERMLRAFTYEG